MASEDVEVVRLTFERFNAGGAMASSDLFADDAEIRGIRAAIEGTAHRGPDAAAEFGRAIEDSWSEIEVADLTCEDLGGGRVLARGLLRSTARDSGIALEQRCWWAVHLNDGLVTRLSTHTEEAEARAELEPG